MTILYDTRKRIKIYRIFKEEVLNVEARVRAI